MTNENPQRVYKAWLALCATLPVRVTDEAATRFLDPSLVSIHFSVKKSKAPVAEARGSESVTEPRP
jgi:hypothetical protein